MSYAPSWLGARAEVHMTVPSGSTSSSASTWLAVTPYLSVWGPPAFSAMLPPIVAAPWLEGSGAKW